MERGRQAGAICAMMDYNEIIAMMEQEIDAQRGNGEMIQQLVSQNKIHSDLGMLLAQIGGLEVMAQTIAKHHEINMVDELEISSVIANKMYHQVMVPVFGRKYPKYLEFAKSRFNKILEISNVPVQYNLKEVLF